MSSLAKLTLSLSVACVSLSLSLCCCRLVAMHANGNITLSRQCTNGATISISGHSQVTVGKAIAPGKETGLPGGKQIDVRIFGSEGMLLYCGDDADTTSGTLQLVRSAR
jgi:hypothetical protein